jgi:hypothetical protein
MKRTILITVGMLGLLGLTKENTENIIIPPEYKEFSYTTEYQCRVCKLTTTVKEALNKHLCTKKDWTYGDSVTWADIETKAWAKERREKEYKLRYRIVEEIVQKAIDKHCEAERKALESLGILEKE